jgi:hypothetical protein
VLRPELVILHRCSYAPVELPKFFVDPCVRVSRETDDVSSSADLSSGVSGAVDDLPISVAGPTTSRERFRCFQELGKA